jgi:hypothetical protein
MDKLTSIPHSSDELIEYARVLGYNIKFILYERMYTIQDINELMPMCLILYQTAEVGHFCCIFRNKEGINFFDSYGNNIDHALTKVNDERRHTLHQDYPYLVKLFDNSKEPIIYNEYKYQGEHSATCGIWCIMRMILSNLTNDEFHAKFKNVDDKKILKLYLSL